MVVDGVEVAWLAADSLETRSVHESLLPEVLVEPSVLLLNAPDSGSSSSYSSWLQSTSSNESFGVVPLPALLSNESKESVFTPANS